MRHAAVETQTLDVFLDAQHSAQALALAITPNLALGQTRLGELSMWKGCAAANAARNGLFAAMLADEIPDLQRGAILMALRIKGESLEELAGFLEACEACYAHLAAPVNTVPVVIPAYNGARQLPNLTPLLAQDDGAGYLHVDPTAVVSPPRISARALAAARYSATSF